MTRCDAELCQYWTGSGCACAVFEIEHDDEGVCSWCGGDSYDQCDDPLGCGDPGHISDDACPCVPCKGTGLRKHQWMF